MTCENPPVLISTFSIVAADLDAREWGIAVASKFLAVGSVVPWASTEVGAIATQAWANVSFGPRGLDLLRNGSSAEEVLNELVTSDENREHRQAGIVDARGGAATYTGESCLPWAGGVSGTGFAIQGNILTGPEVVEAMHETFKTAEGHLADRLLASLLAGDLAGGDSRGRQSAAVLLVREGGGYGGGTDKLLDLRVDDHSEPIPELQRLRVLHKLYLETPDPEDVLDIDGGLRAEILDLLQALEAMDQESGSEEDLEEALRSYMAIENLEMRWAGEGKIDRNVLEFLRSKAYH